MCCEMVSILADRDLQINNVYVSKFIGLIVLV